MPFRFFYSDSGFDSSQLSDDTDASSTTDDSQVPFAEKETEGKDLTEEYQDNILFTCYRNELTLSQETETRYAVHCAKHSCCYLSNVPLYLTQRTLLI